MLYVVLFFLMVSLLLYVLLAGADFGAGIIELFSSKQNRSNTKKKIYRVIGPVWEANHIWIIIVIVILWVGFPRFYNILMIYLHIPLTLILLGITIRGVAFVFRHYDVYIDKSQKVYDWMFRFGSLLTPIFLGMTFGAMIGGQIELSSDMNSTSFYELFVNPWLSPFSILVGLFFASLCAFLAAVLLIGEAKTERKLYVKRARVANITVVIIGFVVLAYGFIRDISFVTDFIKNPYAIGLVIISGILIYPLTYSIKKVRRIKSRFLAGTQVVLILFAAMVTHFPKLIITTSSTINLLETTAEAKVISVLGISLIIGGLIILPGLYHLFKSFKMIKILEKF